MKTIDITPSWEGVLPVLLAVIESGTTVEARATSTKFSRKPRQYSRCHPQN
jgi:hypothetical protein